MKRLVSLAILLILISFPAIAQVTQTGTLDGTVYDQEKQPLPGVTVSIKSPALILPSMEMVTTEHGRYRFPALPPGTYSITFKLQGFKTLVREGIIVNVGVTTTLDVVLEQSALEENVVVTGQAPTVDIQRTVMTSTMTKDLLQNLPASRNISAFFNMAPGVTGDVAHGSSERDNTYNIDGVNMTDPVTGTRAGTFSVDIMEELSIQTGALPAEYGSVRGAVVNAVTKSGGNRFSGQASFFYQNKDLQSDNTKGTIFEGQYSGFDYDYEPSFQLGGPIIKDKIWFFATFSLQKSQEYVFGYPWNQPQQQPLDYKRPMPFIKFTLQPTKKDRIVLSLNYSDYVRHHRDASRSQTVDTTWNQTTPVYTYNFQLTHFFNQNVYMNFKAGYMDYALNLTAKNNMVRTYDSTTRHYSGSYGYDDLYSRDRFQALSDVTYFVDEWFGRHEYKAGIEFEYSADTRYRKHNRDEFGYGPFYYQPTNADGSIKFNATYPYMTNYQDFTRKDRKLVIGAYVQDNWSPLPWITLNLGLRFDHQEGIIPAQGSDREPVVYNNVVYDPRVTKTFKPMIWNTLAPRLGAAFDLTRDGKTALKVSFSRYYIANIMQFFVPANPNSFISWRVHYINGPDGTPIPDPNKLMYNFSATASTKVDPDAKSPHLDEFIIGIEREILSDTRLGVRYIRKWDRNLLEDVNLAALDLNLYKELYKKVGNDAIFDPSVWKIYAPVTAYDDYYHENLTFWERTTMDVAQDEVITNPPGAIRDYKGVEVTLTKRFSHRWSVQASYVWQKSTGLIGTSSDESDSIEAYFDNPNVHINAYGDFENERRNQIKAQFMWRGPWGIMVSGYYRALDGRRYTRYVRSQDLGLNLLQGDTTIAAERRGSRSLPWLTYADIRFEKAFRLPAKVGEVGLFCNIYNITNVAIPTSVFTTSSSYDTINGHLVRFGDPTGLLDPRIFQLGIRYTF
ncbi:MAG: TonB-dependent receptor [Candidatus Saccharicenans sp.]|jgi:outer membrane receptor protein involved in Fe transport|nr:TonB-dependent receptor [Candidatus Saccharicenans sp.]